MNRLAGLVLCGLCAAMGQDISPVPGVFDPKALKFGLPRPVQLPAVVDFVLPNGMRLLLIENRELPLVHGVALIRAGGLFDPPGEAGLAALTGMAMRSAGARGRSGEQLDQALEDLAASVESQAGDDYAQVSFSSPAGSAGKALEIFRDVITAPDFQQERIDLDKAALRDAIARRNGDLQELASRELSALVYGRESPHGQHVDAGSVARITRARVIAFHRRYYTPANVILAITGDFQPEELKAEIANLFSGWSHAGEALPAFPPVRQVPQPGIFLAAAKGHSRTTFSIGRLGGLRSDRDCAALELAAGILAGTGGARLSRRFRTHSSDSAVSAAWNPRHSYPGLFEISGATASGSTTQTLRAAQEELRKLQTTGVSAGELEYARQRVLHSFVFQFDTPPNTLRQVALYEYYGYPRDFISQYQKAVAAVTRADIARVAKQFLKPEDLTIVIAGSPETFGEPLNALGLPVSPAGFFVHAEASSAANATPPNAAPAAQLTTAPAAPLNTASAAQFTTVPAAPPNTAPAAQFTTAPAALPRSAAAAPLTAAPGALALELLHRVQEAVGGAEKLAAVKDYFQTCEFKMSTGAGGMTAKQTNRWAGPSYYRQESEMPIGKIAAYSDGTTGWLVTPQGKTGLPPALLKQIQGDLFRSFFQFLSSDRMPGRTVTSVAPGVIEISDGQSNSARLTIDEATGLPLKQTYTQLQPSGPPSTVEEVYGAWMAVSGIKVPSRITISQNGRKFADVTVTEHRINTGLSPKDLSKWP
ncbi:MAG: insulinase family protein [Bryobacterales bacterium]|nr:insulinase family protein [Bryobacterales bacterium]